MKDQTAATQNNTPEEKVLREAWENGRVTGIRQTLTFIFGEPDRAARLTQNASIRAVMDHVIEEGNKK